MTVIELKEKLIAKINNTDNEELLDSLSRVIELEEGVGDVYILSSNERKAVEEGLKHLKNGQWVSHGSKQPN